MKDSALITEEFLAIASGISQDKEQLLKDGFLETLFSLRTIEDVRRLFSRACEEERLRRTAGFMEGIAYRSRLPQGLHDRSEAYVFAGHPKVTGRDLKAVYNHLPARARMWSILEKRVAPGETWDISFYPPTDVYRDELYSIVNIGRLILEPGARVVSRGNILLLTCQELIKLGNSSQRYDIGIMPTPYGFGGVGRGMNGRSGVAGKNGATGVNGIVPILGANFLGKILPSSFDPLQLNGGNGSDGHPGADGEKGLTGGACKITEINLRQIKTVSPVRIGVFAADGGSGGHGGCGGDGGPGGEAVASFKVYNGIVDAGMPGRGGRGGNGGNGGKGGHSGISSNIYVSVPAGDVSRVDCFSRPGKPGMPGPGGLAGKGGISPPKDRSFDGSPGKEGKKGKEGKVMPAARFFLNGNPV
jgi:hypothetical protein